MSYINHFIRGVPYSRNKRRGKVEAPGQWTKAVKRQTVDLPRPKEAYILKVTFLLPPDKFPTDLPYGPDLDNLLKRLLDALNSTIFLETAGKDSCVVSISATKTRVASTDEAGVRIEVLPISLK